MFASTILSTPNPISYAYGPCPPPILQPTIPTVEAHPLDTCLPYADVALWISENTSPGPNFTVSLALLNSIFLKNIMRIRSPLSHDECLIKKSCPVPATLTQISCLSANLTKVITWASVRG